jgi:hypothetical protein
MACSFQPTTLQSADHVLVLGTDHKLWLENAPFGNVPPGRTFVAATVQDFQYLDDKAIFFRATDSSLFLFNGNVFPLPVDINVQAFQAIDNQTVLVLRTDGNLWLEHAPFGIAPAEHVDGHVHAFQELDSGSILVLGTDGNLWFEHQPFGNAPPVEVDSNVQAFQGIDDQTILVLRTDRTLWLEQGSFSACSIWVICPPPPTRQQVESNVLAFQGFRGLFGDVPTVLVLGTDRKLWAEHAPFGIDPPAREQVDGNVAGFYGLIGAAFSLGSPGDQTVLVLGTDGNLWLETAPFGTVIPPARTKIDANVIM